MVLAVLTVVGLGGLIVRELKAEHPIIDLTVFKYRSFAVGTFLMTVVGFVLYGSTVLLPLFMQILLGYTATHAGVTNLPRGMASFLFMPLIGFLTSKVDVRKLLGAGILASAVAMFLLSRLSLDVGFADFVFPLALQGAALGLIFVPLTTVTNDPVPKERLGNATSLFNLMRNIGASIGISGVTTIQVRNAQKHLHDLEPTSRAATCSGNAPLPACSNSSSAKARTLRCCIARRRQPLAWCSGRQPCFRTPTPPFSGDTVCGDVPPDLPDEEAAEEGGGANGALGRYCTPFTPIPFYQTLPTRRRCT